MQASASAFRTRARLAAALLACLYAQGHAASVTALATASVVEPVAITTRVGPVTPSGSVGLTRLIVLRASPAGAPPVSPASDTAVVTVEGDGHTYSVSATTSNIAAQASAVASDSPAGHILLVGGLVMAGLAQAHVAGRGDILVTIDYN